MECDKLKEECGVFGIFSNEYNSKISTLIYYGLYALQHRGQESSGIAVVNDNDIICHKDTGLVREVFSKNILDNLNGHGSIGHVRYSTTGDGIKKNAQPLLGFFNKEKIAIAHNGNLTNIIELKKILQSKGIIFNTSTDSEVILKLIENSNKGNLTYAIQNSLLKLKGSFSIVILSNDKLICARDPFGIRPLCIGKLNNSYVVSSESCALNAIGATFIRDILPGELLIIDKNNLSSIIYSKKNKCATCSFEYIYFSREDSTIDNIGVYASRYLAGKELYKESKTSADVVIGVPSSGIPAALGYSKASGIPYTVGLTKNNYIDRSFIKPSQKLREECVNIKLSPIKDNVYGKRVIVIDDSLVRGHTSKKIINSLRESGATEVHFKVASPIVKYPCNLGIDTFNNKELLGSHLTLKEIKNIIGADSLCYLSVHGLLNAIKRTDICIGCFNNIYPV